MRSHEVKISHNEKNGALVSGFCMTCNVALRSWSEVHQHSPRLLALIRRNKKAKEE